MTIAYIERNPVRAKMVRRAWQYKWSSAKAHMDGKNEIGILDMVAWKISLKKVNVPIF